MHKGNFAIYLMLITTVALYLHCSAPEQIVGGNSSETVIGKINNANGTPACSTIVTLYPVDYDPVVAKNIAHDCISDTTDDNGVYILRVPKNGARWSPIAPR